MVKKHVIDFSKVKGGGGQFTKRRVTEGDYKARITKVEDAESSSDGGDMWLFTIELVDKARATYPYYCKLEKSSYWKVRGIFEAAGVVVPNKKVAADPTKLVKKLIGISLQDTEYEGRQQSEIGAVFPLSELSGKHGASDDEEEVEEEEDDEEESEEEESEDEDEDEDEEEESEAEKKKRLKRERARKRREAREKKAKKKKDEDEEEEEDEDELEELEIEEL